MYYQNNPCFKYSYKRSKSLIAVHYDVPHRIRAITNRREDSGCENARRSSGAVRPCTESFGSV